MKAAREKQLIMYKRFSIRLIAETIKFLEENIRRTLFDINNCSIILDLSPKAKKAKINKWELIKLKGFCTAKESNNKTKRLPTEWEKIYA